MTKATIDDKNLPHLQQALDSAAMAPAFEEFFRREYPERGLSVEACYIGRVYHKPGKNCGILYHLRCRDRDLRLSSPVLHGKMFANGEAQDKILKAQPESWPGCGFWKPVRFWPEMEMLLHTFPYDPRLPYLGQLSEADFVKRQIEENLAGFGLSNEWKCRDLVWGVVKYMPTKRCILRYDLVFTDAANNLRPFAFYSKTYDSPRSRYVYEALQKIWASPACHTGVLNIPRPIAHLDSANTLWQLAWEGRGFTEVVGPTGWANLPRSGFVPKIASMLAALHQIPSTGLQLQSGASPAIMLKGVEEEVAKLLPFLPEHEEILTRLLTTMTTGAPSSAAPIPQVTLHGAFKLAQILCRVDPDGNSHLALVDFDAIACGDPHYDLAEFIASLVFLRISNGISAAPLGESVELFLSDYQKQTPWACKPQRLAWYVVAFLLGKIHSSLKRGETMGAANLAAAFDLVHEWLERVAK